MPDLLDRIVKGVASLRSSPENPSTPLSAPAEWLFEALGASKVSSGVRVNVNSAMSLTAFWACVKIIAETVGSLPLHVYRRLGDQNNKKATDRQEYRLLHDELNPQLSSMVGREACQAHVLTWGNTYLLIQYSQAGKVKYLWPLRPEKTRAERVAGDLVYVTTDTPDGSERTYSYEEIIHVPGLSFDGVSGLSPIGFHRETIGYGIAVERYGASFFGRGERPAGVLEHPATLTDEAYGRLQTSIKERINVAGSPHSTLILEEGMKWNAVTMPNNEAQYIETRKFNVADMARIFRVPLAMLEEHDKAAAYASVEQFFLQFAVHTIRPWLVRWEQELNRKIFGVGSELFCEHSLDALLRGDLKSRYDAYHIGIQDGFLTWNDVLQKENMNAVDGEGGDTHFVPVNSQPVERALHPPEPPAPTQPNPAPPSSATRHGSNGHATEGGLEI